MKNAIQILITGDFFGGRRIEKLIESNNFDTIFNDFISEIRNVDIAITNLESPLTSAKKKIDKTGPSLKAIPKTIQALKYAGFNLLTLANNHIMDYGIDGLNDTLELCRNQRIDFVGVGDNVEMASMPSYKYVCGKKIAFINIAENEWASATSETAGANPLNPISNFYSIRNASKSADYVFVIVHGGNEMYKLPSPRIKELFRFFIEAGASSVIGHHPHCFSGYEEYNGKPIFYSLGNFVFDNFNNHDSDWNYGYAVKFTIKDDELKFELIPYTQGYPIRGVRKLNELQNTLFKEEIISLQKIILDDVLLRVRFNEFCFKMKRGFNNYIEPYSNKFIHALRNYGFIPSLLSRRKRLLYLNLIRCEALRDVTKVVLQEKLKKESVNSYNKITTLK